MRLIDKEQAQKMLLDLVSRVHFRGAYFAGNRRTQARILD